MNEHEYSRSHTRSRDLTTIHFRVEATQSNSILNLKNWNGTN